VDSVSFDGITTAKGKFQADASPVNLAWGAIGQYTDLINPCSFLTYVGAIANGGEGVTPYVVEKITTEDGVAYKAKTQLRDRVMSKETAAVLKEYMRNNVASKYSDSYFPGLNVCAKTGTAEVAGSDHNAMLAGFVMDEAYPLAFVVCVQDAGYGITQALPIASKVLAECKNVLDN
jgi:peptidoglycan glycosyltransferase